MGLFGSRDNLALLITQSCEERDGAVADIIVGLGAAVALPQRKRALCALQCLALTLFVTTEHQSSLGRIQIEPDNVPEFLFKVRIIGDLKSLQPMWLNFVIAPNPLYRALAFWHENDPLQKMGRAAIGIDFLLLNLKPVGKSTKLVKTRIL